MKYVMNTGLQQKTLVKYNLDLIDACIIRYMLDFCNTKKIVKRIFYGEMYFWIKYQSIIDNFPIFNIKTTDRIGKRIKKLIDINLLKLKIYKCKKGTYSFFKFNEEILEEFLDYDVNIISNKNKKDNPPVPKTESKGHPPVPKTESKGHPPVPKTEPYNSSINYSSININSNINEREENTSYRNEKESSPPGDTIFYKSEFFTIYKNENDILQLSFPTINTIYGYDSLQKWIINKIKQKKKITFIKSQQDLIHFIEKTWFKNLALALENKKKLIYDSKFFKVNLYNHNLLLNSGQDEDMLFKYYDEISEHLKKNEWQREEIKKYGNFKNIINKWISIRNDDSEE
jgi:hypothetical protein